MPDHDHRPHVHAEKPHEDHTRERDCPGDEDFGGEVLEPDMTTADSGGNSPPPSPPKTPPQPSGG